ncbi:heavy metal translocating P-type ATPase [Natronobacterium gregoryi]|nr:heavy metal translocating P-type ATPase [Natronobacterium gregoryi]ELY67018.1 cadmium-translocating P-type ATPase [Natronobacterium gregoryi SP2]PLK21256.1 cadmium-translocating P-type ATPase [Natronobacterium gregoryi SP2]
MDRSASHDASVDGDEAAPDRSTLRREGAFVVLTFVGMIGGLLASWFGGPSWLVWTCYIGAYVFGGWYGLKESIEALQEPAVEIDLLMIIAALGALTIGAPFEGAMLLFLFSLSNVLQHYAIGRSRDAIRSLMQMRPESAQLLRDGEEVTVPIDDVEIGEVFVVRPGDRIPLDGVVDSGETTVDQSSLTGESVPVPKAPGDEVFGGTINETGSLEVRVTREAEESAISKLIHMVEEARSEKAPTQRLIDRLEQPYVLSVFAFTAVAIALPLALGHEFDSTFYRAMTLMVAASPCAVILSTPAAVLSAITAGARQGVLFKGGEHVERTATVDAVAFDKTGTLTEGNTRLTDVTTRDGASLEGDDRLLALAAAVQSRSEHHLAEATVEAAEERGLETATASGFEAVVGKGVHATVDERTIHIGNARYFETVTDGETIAGLEDGLAAVRSLENDGKTSVLVAREDGGDLEVLGWLAFTDTVRETAAETIERLRELGVEQIVMLTGDNERVARSIAAELGIDEVYAELLPEQKVDRIERLQKRHEAVAMVGDGVNDAPALATADVSVGMGGAGTDVALETSEVVLMSDDLEKLPYALALGRETRKTLFVNLAIAFGAIVIMIVAILTAGIPLPLAVIGHEGSTVLVCLIGLRLIGFQGA